MADGTQLACVTLKCRQCSDHATVALVTISIGQRAGRIVMSPSEVDPALIDQTVSFSDIPSMVFPMVVLYCDACYKHSGVGRWRMF